MAKKSTVRLESRFPAAKKGAHDAVKAAVGHALDEGEAEAEKRLERANDSRGWNLPTDVEQEGIGFQSGRIFYSEFYGRFFEYGAVHLPASPFMRPAHRSMRKRFVDEMDDDFEGWVRKRTRFSR